MSTATVCRTVRQNDTGVIFTVTIVECDPDDPNTLIVKDISGATVKELNFKKPDGTVVEQTAVFTTDGSDGKIQYTSVVDDLDEAGRWFLEGYVETPTGNFTSVRGHFDVDEVIA